MIITGKQFIGNTKSAKGTTTFHSSNNSEHIFYEATSEEIGEAVEKAHEAFLQYRNLPGSVKASFLQTIAT